MEPVGDWEIDHPENRERVRVPRCEPVPEHYFKCGFCGESLDRVGEWLCADKRACYACACRWTAGNSVPPAVRIR